MSNLESLVEAKTLLFQSGLDRITVNTKPVKYLKNVPMSLIMHLGKIFVSESFFLLFHQKLRDLRDCHLCTFFSKNLFPLKHETILFSWRNIM